VIAAGIYSEHTTKLDLFCLLSSLSDRFVGNLSYIVFSIKIPSVVRFLEKDRRQKRSNYVKEPRCYIDYLALLPLKHVTFIYSNYAFCLLIMSGQFVKFIINVTPWFLDVVRSLLSPILLIRPFRWQS
jgi:hypothetical protein